MNLFIDTNIYLTFYHYSNDDLEELRKLAVAIKSGEISLSLTQQVKDEFKRNRESKIADALKRFREQKLNREFPQMCKEYADYKRLRDAIKQYEESKDKLFQRLRADIEGKTLGADQVIAELFAKAELLDYDDKILAAAKRRIELGNPPGKSGSLGDAINWETLLEKMPHGELYLITEDKDYMSQVNEEKLAEFLLEEWAEKKGSNVLFYRRLSDFFSDKFPTIKLASEWEKELAIARLMWTGSFRATHAAIARVASFSDFTDDQINQIVDAAVSNTQISWICNDPDVRSFLESVVHGNEDIIEPAKLKAFNSLYHEDSGEARAIGVEEVPP
jgi:hypothetical protein